MKIFFFGEREKNIKELDYDGGNWQQFHKIKFWKRQAKRYWNAHQAQKERERKRERGRRIREWVWIRKREGESEGRMAEEIGYGEKRKGGVFVI